MNDTAEATAPNTVTRSLECSLTDAEALERAHDIGELSAEARRLKVERRSLNARLRECNERVADLADAIEQRSETRDVVCEWRPDYERKLWELFRTDSDQPIGEAREMSEIDLQRRLPLDADTPADPPMRLIPGKRKRAAAANTANGATKPAAKRRKRAAAISA